MKKHFKSIQFINWSFTVLVDNTAGELLIIMSFWNIHFFQYSALRIPEKGYFRKRLKISVDFFLCLYWTSKDNLNTINLIQPISIWKQFSFQKIELMKALSATLGQNNQVSDNMSNFQLKHPMNDRQKQLLNIYYFFKINMLLFLRTKVQMILPVYVNLTTTSILLHAYK